MPTNVRRYRHASLMKNESVQTPHPAVQLNLFWPDLLFLCGNRLDAVVQLSIELDSSCRKRHKIRRNVKRWINDVERKTCPFSHTSKCVCPSGKKLTDVIARIQFNYIWRQWTIWQTLPRPVTTKSGSFMTISWSSYAAWKRKIWAVAYSNIIR